VAFLPLLCCTSKETIPLFGSRGLASQIGSIEYARPRRFREKLDSWLQSIRVLWPECPAKISSDGICQVVDHAYAVLVNDRGNLAVAPNGGMA